MLQRLLRSQSFVTTANRSVPVNFMHARLAAARLVDDHGAKIALADSNFQGTGVHSIFAVVPIFEFYVCLSMMGLALTLGAHRPYVGPHTGHEPSSAAGRTQQPLTHGSA